MATGWSHVTNYVWCKTNWTPEPQQVFDDGIYLRQIGPLRYFLGTTCYTPFGTNMNDMVAGSFFYDTNTYVLYVWLADNSDPNSSYMEASSRTFLIYTDSTNEDSYFGFRGLKFRHSNTCTVTNGWPAIFTGGNSIIENCDVQWCDFAGVSLGPHSQAINCNISNNGDNGVGGQADFLIRGCTILSNNYRHFNPAWHAGGIKIIPDYYGTIENCEVARNDGPGVWFDYCRTGMPLIVRNNYIHHNDGDGIFIEVSTNAHIYNNLLMANSPRSIYISSSADNTIRNNTIAQSRDWIALEAAYYPTRTNELGQVFPMRNNRFCNNIIYETQGISDLAIHEEDGSNVTGNVSDYNCFYKFNGTSTVRMILNRFEGGGVAYTNLADWSAATGWDKHSLNLDPLFFNEADVNYHLKSAAGTYSNGVWIICDATSPCIDTGEPSAVFSNEPPWNGGRINIGCYGNTESASKSPDQDGDGLSDPLEVYILGSDPGSQDSDGDSMSDYDEYIAGTDPTNKSSYLRILCTNDISLMTNGFGITWFGNEERFYHVYSTTDLLHGVWNVESGLVDRLGMTMIERQGSNKWIVVTDTNAFRQSRRFYRIGVRRP